MLQSARNVLTFTNINNACLFCEYGINSLEFIPIIGIGACAFRGGLASLQLIYGISASVLGMTGRLTCTFIHSSDKQQSFKQQSFCNRVTLHGMEFFMHANLNIWRSTAVVIITIALFGLGHYLVYRFNRKLGIVVWYSGIKN